MVAATIFSAGTIKGIREMKKELRVCTQEEIDSQLETQWNELEDVCFDEDSDGELILSEDWYHFPKGTIREEIWHWFDDRHSKGVAWLLYGDE